MSFAAMISPTSGWRAEPFALLEATVNDLQEQMKAGRMTARAVTELYLERIRLLNHEGPELRAIIETNPEALEVADRLDAERRSRGPRGPLHGIPVVLKDNIATHDRMTTTAGSLALAGSTPKRDAFVAANLRAAGAILLGKANMSEWSYARGLRASSGWSARGGQCRNPYALDRSPSGSSSGSAVAVAANLTSIALGTDTAGSVLGPSSINGIVGIRPTVGLLSRSGIIPWSRYRDTPGPMARTVRDAAIVLGVLAGIDNDDVATHSSHDHLQADYTQFLDPVGLRGMRIGVPRQLSGFRSNLIELFEKAIHQLQAAGAVIIDPVNLSTAIIDQGLADLLIRLSHHELRISIDEYLNGLGADAPMRSLADIIAFNEVHSDQELSLFGQETFLAAQNQAALTQQEYREGVNEIRRRMRNDIDTVLNRHKLDLVVTPTSDPAWLIDHIYGDRLDGGLSVEGSTLAGYPSISVPMGQLSGLPVGLSFLGPAWSEPILLQGAYAYEQATLCRSAPGFLKSTARNDAPLE